MGKDILAMEARLENHISKEINKINRDILKTEAVAKTSFTSASTSANKLTTAIKGFALGAVTIMALTKAWGKLNAIANEGVDLYKIQVNAEAALTSAMGRSSASLMKYASELQQVTTYGDEETISAMARIGQFIKEEDQIRRLMPLIQDLAASKQMSLVSAADMVTKSVASSTNSMARYGIEIEGVAGSVDRIDSAVVALTDKFGGMAEAVAKTDVGKLQQVENTISDTKELIGKELIPVLTEWRKLQLKMAIEFVSLADAWGYLLNKGSGGQKKASTERASEIVDEIILEKKLIKEYENYQKKLRENKEYADKQLKLNRISVYIAPQQPLITKEQYEQAKEKLVALRKEGMEFAPPPVVTDDDGSGGGGGGGGTEITNAQAVYAQLAEMRAKDAEDSWRTQQFKQSQIDVYNQLEQERTDFAKLQWEERLAAEDAALQKSLDKNRDFESEVDRLKKKAGKDLVKVTISVFRMMARENKKYAALYKTTAIGQVIVDTIKGAQAAFTGMVQTIPGPVGLVLGTLAATTVAATGALNVKEIASQKFAHGGIVGGNALTGDKINGRMNSREMVLTRGQQSELFQIANGNGKTTNNSNVVVNFVIPDNANITDAGAESISQSINSIGDVLLEADRGGLLDDFKQQFTQVEG